MTLDHGKKGKIYEIVGVKKPSDKISRRFLELGMTSGQHLKISAMSLSKKVFLIEIRGYVLSIRANLLNVVEVREC